jgi:hypothetical protein
MDIRYGLYLRVTLLVTCRKIEDKSQSHHEIDNSYHTYQQIGDDAELSPPDRWSRKSDELNKRDGFIHPSIPDETFLAPFPISNEAPTQTDPKAWSPYLSFQTETCKLFLSTVLSLPNPHTYSIKGLTTCIEIISLITTHYSVVYSRLYSQMRKIIFRAASVN